MSLYSETICRYVADDRYVGRLEPADGVGEIGLGAQEAGRQIAARFALRLRDDRVSDLRFQVFGCGFSVAACAAAAELAAGQPLAAVAALTAAAVDRQLDGLPAERHYCAELAVSALQAAVASACQGQGAVWATAAPAEEHGPRVSADDPLYRRLLVSPVPLAVVGADRALLAGLVAVAAQEPAGLAGLGLKSADLGRMLRRFFPRIDLGDLPNDAAAAPPVDPALRSLLLSYVPADAATPLPRWLALALAARAAHPEHLWVAMGLPERSALTAAIARHLPALAAANTPPMRWKRFFAKRICDQSGGTLCKAPNCGVCPEYAICFAPEEEDQGS